MADRELNPKTGKRYTVEEFTVMAIEKLTQPPYKGIHAVYSGFNAAFEKYFPGLNAEAETKELIRQGKISFRPAKKGGVTLYLKGEEPHEKRVNSALDTILGNKK